MSVNDPAQAADASPVDRTILDLTRIEHFFDERLFQVSVQFQEKPSPSDAARLKRIVPHLAGQSVAEVHRLIAAAPEWVVGQFYRGETERLVQALTEARFAATVTDVPAPPPDSPPSTPRG
jgi:hypothetical protein